MQETDQPEVLPKLIPGIVSESVLLIWSGFQYRSAICSFLCDHLLTHLFVPGSMQQFLKEILNDLCMYNKRGPNQGTHELKPEYKKSSEDAAGAPWRMIYLFGGCCVTVIPGTSWIDARNDELSIWSLQSCLGCICLLFIKRHCCNCMGISWYIYNTCHRWEMNLLINHMKDRLISRVDVRIMLRIRRVRSAFLMRTPLL